MSNWRARKRRKEIVTLVRQEGFDAAFAGKHEQTNPYGNDMNRHQWAMGYLEGLAEKQRQELSVPNPCTICGQPIKGSYAGTGDGQMTDGGSFAHLDCYREKHP